MAITKIKPIRGTLSKALAYIQAPEKTDEKLLVSSFGCAVETAAKEFEWTRKVAEQRGMSQPTIVARHVIQSFDIGEVSPELAHEIGRQFADEFLRGKYEYVLATHIDRGHVHNHIIFNAVNFVDYHAYKSYKKVYYETREISDRICKEHGLSVIPPSQNRGMNYKEYTETKHGTSWKQKLRQAIDRCVIVAGDYDDFLRLMKDAGYEIKTGKYISFRAKGQERFTRAKTIGENYTEERLKDRIAGRVVRKSPYIEQKGISLIIDIQNSIKAQESKGYEHWAKVNNLKQAAKTLNYLTENNLLQYAVLEAKIADVNGSYARNNDNLKEVEHRLREVQPLIKHVTQYRRLKPLYEQYEKAKDKTKFRKQYQSELIIFEASRDTLRAIQGNKKLPSLKSLQTEQSKLMEEQQGLYEERAKLKRQKKRLDLVKKNVDSILGSSRDTERSTPEKVQTPNLESNS